MNQVRLNTATPAWCVGQMLIGPLPRQNLGLEAKSCGELIPQRGELTCLEHQDMVAWAQRIG